MMCRAQHLQQRIHMVARRSELCRGPLICRPPLERLSRIRQQLAMFVRALCCRREVAASLQTAKGGTPCGVILRTLLQAMQRLSALPGIRQQPGTCSELVVGTR